ncbi:sensor histidine kinase [Solihabitans fulvus]|uniref:histidine kinase n=2 Tax=Solihabitans fulvus TaxID=1892852 RepID=A0A5B2XLH1_9PSEU|nr:sensor histidine kinase [Solihabitans fulvus]
MVGAALPLLWRRRFPLTVFVLSASAAGTYYWLSGLGGPAAVLAVVALFTLARQRGPLVAGVAAGCVVLAGIADEVVSGDSEWWYLDARLLGMAALLAAVVASGVAARSRQGWAAARREKAEEQARRLAEEERLRIAREVHDVVAHSLAMINVQAGVAVHVADRRPDKAVEALIAIKEASRAALVDLRATLGVLRTGEGNAPAPTVRRMDELFAPLAAAGIPVQVSGEHGELPAPVDVATYRILQESLTNALRYAPDASLITVRFRRAEDSLEITVRDNGSGAASPSVGAGSGLRGMRERAEALRGSLTAGPAPDGGFEVRAMLPVGGDAE